MRLVQMALAAGFAGILHSAHAGQDISSMSLEALTSAEVTGASRFTQRLSDAPSNVTLITSADIRTFGYRTLADILRAVRGVYVSSDHIYDYAGVRGFSRPGDLNTRVLLLIDGYRYTDPIYQQTLLLGTEGLIDVDMIDRVEFIPGPGSALYGSNAFFGVVNIITRKPGEFRNGMASAAISSNNTYEGKLALSGKTANGLEWLGSLTRYRSEGEDFHIPEHAAINNGVAQGMDSDDSYRAFGKLIWGPFMLELSHLNRDKGLPTAPFGILFNDKRAVWTDKVTFLDLRYQENLRDELSFSGRLYAGDYRFEGMYPYEPEPTINIDTTHTQWWGVEGMGSWSGVKGHQFAAGFELEQQPKRIQRNADYDPDFLYLDDRRSGSRYGFFLQDQWRVSPGWIVDMGLRYDHYSDFGGTTNPRLAVLHQRGQDTYRFLYGSAFRAPSTFEAFYHNGPSQIDNPGLRPETIRTWEASWERRWEAAMRTVLSLYHYDSEDLISLKEVADGIVQYQNGGTMSARGAEFEAEYAWKNGVRVKASYANQRAESDTGKTAVNSPKHLYKLNLVVPVQGNLQAGVEIQGMGERKTTSGKVDGHVLANLTLTGGDKQSWLWSLSAYNLLDEKYSDPASTEFLQDANPQYGRQLRLKLERRF